MRPNPTAPAGGQALESLESSSTIQHSLVERLVEMTSRAQVCRVRASPLASVRVPYTVG